MLSADLRHLVAAAARDAGYPGHWPDVGLRDGGAPGRYSCSLPLRLAANPAEVAANMAARLRVADWIEDAQPTGHGYLTITVTPDKLTDTAVRVTEAGPGCARSDALAGTSRTAPPPACLTAARSWPEARDLVVAQVTARLAAAAGATVAVHDSAERASVPVDPTAGTGPVPDTVSLDPTAGTDPVADAVAFAGPDAITYTLARIPAEHPAALDPAACARHVPANPAYAVRYAHSCAASTLRWAAALDLTRGEAAVVRPGSLAHPRERAVLAALSWLPEQVARAARRGRPHEFAAFLEELAETYQVCRVACPAWPERGQEGARREGLPGDAGTVRARLWLAGAGAVGLGTGLELLGVRAPGRL